MKRLLIIGVVGYVIVEDLYLMILLIVVVYMSWVD